jgi:lipopolysaccharide/colanic/teichoic acid biosynthesis glycosyltransferase
VLELHPDQVQSDPRFKMRPGLTGLWQVSARCDPDLATRVHFDSLYVADWSLLLDLKILVKTVPVVLRGQGGAIAQRPGDELDAGPAARFVGVSSKDR